VRSVEQLGSGDGLALVATNAPGRHLSEVFTMARSADAVVSLIRQLTSALEKGGGGIAHGALPADRIMVTRDFATLNLANGARTPSSDRIVRRT
jgi:hypothetical protein